MTHKMSIIDVFILLAQNGWVEDIIPAWTTCRDIFYDDTFTERLNTLFEERSMDYLCDKQEVEAGNCCDDYEVMGNCYCLDIAKWYYYDDEQRLLSLMRLLYTRKEFFPY